MKLGVHFIVVIIIAIISVSIVFNDYINSLSIREFRKGYEKGVWDTMLYNKATNEYPSMFWRNENFDKDFQSTDDINNSINYYLSNNIFNMNNFDNKTCSITITKTLIVDINLNGEQLNNYYNCTPTIYVDTSERPGVEIIYAENLTIQSSYGTEQININKYNRSKNE